MLRERCFGDLEGKPLHMMMDAIKVQSTEIEITEENIIFRTHFFHSNFFVCIALENEMKILIF